MFFNPAAVHFVDSIVIDKAKSFFSFGLDLLMYNIRQNVNNDTLSILYVPFALAYFKLFIVLVSEDSEHYYNVIAYKTE